MTKYIGTQGAKSEKKDIKAPDPAIRVRILYESDLTLHLSIMLVVNKNDEPSLILSIITKMYGICICPINIRLRSL